MSAHGPATLISVDGPGSVIYGFGVGMANFGAGRSRLPRQIAADVRAVLPLVAWYGPTGNLALTAGECVDVAQRLAEITSTAWAVIPARDLADALGALKAEPVPPAEAGIRATPGLAFAVEPAQAGPIRSIPKIAALRRLNDRIVLVHKFDVLKGNRLDRAPTGRLGPDISRGRQAGWRPVDSPKPPAIRGPANPGRTLGRPWRASIADRRSHSWAGSG
jgi:hypothetical protein